MPTRPFVRLKSIVSNTVNRPSSRTVTSTTRAVIPCSLSVCGQTRHSIRESESDDGRGLSTRIALFGSHRRTRQLKARQRLTREASTIRCPLSPLAPAGPRRLVHAIAMNITERRALRTMGANHGVHPCQRSHAAIPLRKRFGKVKRDAISHQLITFTRLSL